MHKRRFVSVDDLAPYEDSYIYTAIHSLLESIIMGSFEWMDEAEFYLDDQLDEDDNKLLFQIRIGRCIDVNEDEYKDSGDFIETYASSKNSILSRLQSLLMPALNEETLLAEDLPVNAPRLYPDQFVVRTHKINMKANVGVNNNKGEANVTMSNEILIDLVISIEDILGLEPQALYTRYKYLCSHNTGESLDELRQWAADLGIHYLQPASKEILCYDIAEYYGFDK